MIQSVKNWCKTTSSILALMEWQFVVETVIIAEVEEIVNVCPNTIDVYKNNS